LRQHPAETPLPTVELRTCVQSGADGSLIVTFRLTGHLSNLYLPAPSATYRRDGLWRHTCFEIFVAADGEAYREFNFSPAGCWAGYSFARYRTPCVPAWRPPRPALATLRQENAFTLTARLAADTLPPTPSRQARRLALSAVIETAAGGLSYWALHHPRERPDFHHEQGFVLYPDPPRNSPC